MKRNELKDILEKISLGENVNYGKIADSAGISRPNISVIMNSEPEKDVSRKIIDRLKNSYPSYFNKTDKTDKKISITNESTDTVAMDIGASIIKIEATVDVAFSVLAELLALQKGIVGTILLKDLEKAVASRIDFLQQQRKDV